MGSLGQGQAHESHLGPISEHIDISAFLMSVEELRFGLAALEPNTANHSSHTSPLSISSAHGGSSSPPTGSSVIAAECSVDDLKSSLEGILTDPKLNVHVTKTHQAIVHSIYETADTSSRKKRRRTTLPDPSNDPPDVIELRFNMDNTKLRSWPLTLQSASFIRPPKHSDRNTLSDTKRFCHGSRTFNTHEALIFVTIYNKLSWGHRQLFRSSQHVLLSSQTLGDLFEVIPCHSNEIPAEITNEAEVRLGYEKSRMHTRAMDGSTGCVICIDGTLYGDGQSEVDYSEKLLRLLSGLPNDKGQRPTLSKGMSMHDTPFASLTVQLHKPYWLLHAGNCEHFWMIDQIRLHHPADPPVSAFPLTTQITPPLLDLCRACNKVPAIYAVTGDIRLGESPFVICGPCWRWMGEQKGSAAEGVMVVPLPRHEQGWSV